MFLEPIQATSLGCYGLINEMILDRIENDRYDNENYLKIMTEIIAFINLHYYSGSNFDTPFWNMARKGARELFGDTDVSTYDWNHILDWNPQFRKKMFDSFL